jgi:hypothetical protein
MVRQAHHERWDLISSGLIPRSLGRRLAESQRFEERGALFQRFLDRITPSLCLKRKILRHREALSPPIYPERINWFIFNLQIFRELLQLAPPPKKILYVVVFGFTQNKIFGE